MLPRTIVANTAGIALALTLGLASAGDAAVIWNEAINGDFSGNNLAPTPLGTLGIGDNEVFGSTGRNAAGVVDRDYFTFTVPAGLALGAIIVLDGTTSLGPTNISFIGISAGNMVNHDPNVVTDALGLLGWRHYAGAPNPQSDIGINILGEIGSPPIQPPAGVPGATGFTPPLPAGAYSVWIQETATGSANYGFDFVLVPEPASAAALLTGLVFLAALRRRRQSSAGLVDDPLALAR